MIHRDKRIGSRSRAGSAEGVACPSVRGRGAGMAGHDPRACVLRAAHRPLLPSRANTRYYILTPMIRITFGEPKLARKAESHGRETGRREKSFKAVAGEAPKQSALRRKWGILFTTNPNKRKCGSGKQQTITRFLKFSAAD